MYSIVISFQINDISILYLSSPRMLVNVNMYATKQQTHVYSPVQKRLQILPYFI